MPQSQGPQEARSLSRVFVAAMAFVDRIPDMAGIETNRFGIPDAERNTPDFGRVLNPGNREMIT